jgi:hypothetical protein
MTEQQKKLDDLMHSLKQQWDELRVRAHLAKADIKDEWDKVERQFTRLMDDYKPTRDAANQTAVNVWSALLLTGEEVLKGFERIRKTL